MTLQPHFSRASVGIFVLLAALCLFGLACASSSGAQRNAADERVTGHPPSAEQDVAHTLPRGPDILTGIEDAQGDGAVEGALAPGEATVSRDALKRFILKGPSFPLSMVEVEPARDGSKFVGYRVLSIAPTAQPTLKGRLKTGDIITHLNGVRVEKPDDYLNAWKLLADISTMRIDYLRDGAPSFSIWQVQ